MLLAEPRVRFALLGALAALAAGGLIAFAINFAHRGERPSQPPASQGGLVIDAAGAGLGRIDPARPLRCFVAGKPAGEMSLADCAKRNGVATGALDVGLDASRTCGRADGAGEGDPARPAAAGRAGGPHARPGPGAAGGLLALRGQPMAPAP